MAIFPTNAFCPVSQKNIDERVARFNAAITVIILTGFFFGQFVFAIVFLAIDFLLRASGNERYSAVAITSSNIVRYFEVRKNIINAGPKLFAARIGFFLCLLASVAWLFEWKLTAIILVTLLGIFSFLEAVAGICVACIIYPYVYRLIYK